MREGSEFLPRQHNCNRDFKKNPMGKQLYCYFAATGSSKTSCRAFGVRFTVTL